jgi:hypothetical protein
MNQDNIDYARRAQSRDLPIGKICLFALALAVLGACAFIAYMG